MILFGLTGKIADVETVFLFGELEDEIFMECPHGMPGVGPQDILALLMCIYGLVQAARQYYKKIVKILKSIGFEGGDVDPCLFVKKDDKLGLVYIALYVDDNLLVGHTLAVDDVIKKMKEKGLILKVENDLHDYLSCKIVFSEDNKKA